MKKLILLQLALLFLATTFSSSPPPPGWYQQTLPVNDFINDIFFLDSLNGWVATKGQPNINDTAYIMRTINGGNNWQVQLINLDSYNAIQFLDINTGYVAAGWNVARVLKTTNGGENWFEAHNFGLGFGMNDIGFINKDTGWACADDIFDGGLWKTTDGGQSWSIQLNHSYEPTKIFFINKDTGWIGNTIDKLYKTTNGGINWNNQFTFSTGSNFKDILFINKDTGWVSEGNENKVQFSSDGGNNWMAQILPPKSGIIITSRSERISSTDGKTVWSVGGGVFYGIGRFRGIIYKTTNSGNNWSYQIPDTSINIGRYTNIQFVNDSIGWATYAGIVHTTDGGGPLVKINNINSEIPKNYVLYQNYPNPFNPRTTINYQLSMSNFVSLKVYDLLGNEVAAIINQRQNAGEYKVEFDGSILTSGVYFYKLEIFDGKSNPAFTETKKMILIR